MKNKQKTSRLNCNCQKTLSERPLLAEQFADPCVEDCSRHECKGMQHLILLNLLLLHLPLLLVRLQCNSFN